MLVNRRDVEIEWGDCDAAGIVFYPRYFAMFDASTAYLFEKALGQKKIDWIRTYEIVGIPVVDTAAQFLLPSRYGDVVSIETKVIEIRRSSLDIGHRLFKAEVCALEARETRVWTARDDADPGRLRARPIPRQVVEALSAG